MFQQFTGINTVIYYAPVIFQFAGLRSHSAAILATAGVGVINVMLTIVAVSLIDRVGRRPLLLYGLAGMIVSLGGLGFGFLSPNLSQELAWISVICVMFYVGLFRNRPWSGVLADDFRNLSPKNPRAGDGNPRRSRTWGSNLLSSPDVPEFAPLFRTAMDVLAVCARRSGWRGSSSRRWCLKQKEKP